MSTVQVPAPMGSLMQDADAEEIQQYFAQYGPVNATEVARNDSELIGMALHHGTVRQQRELVLAAAQRAVYEGKSAAAELDKVS